LAYIDTNNVVGYYSTVAVVKYTDEPTIEIVGLNMQAMTTIGSTKFVGHYANSDISEKVYQYCFTLYDNIGNVLETSGKLLHNVSLDESQTESQDIFSFKYNLIENKLYRVRYEIITNNGLTLSTVGYEISVTSLVGSDLNVLIKPELDYENARITEVQFHVMQAVAELYPDKRAFDVIDGYGLFDKVCGTDYVRTVFGKEYKVNDIIDYWRKDEASFRVLSQKYHIY
jgi:hypothetical protein